MSSWMTSASPAHRQSNHRALLPLGVPDVVAQYHKVDTSEEHIFHQYPCRDTIACVWTRPERTPGCHLRFPLIQ
uniref:Uncharacterized protein n=1 Tax=Arundo donax TaxID=35708 RepID=A0A0A9DHH2_ARUDO